MQTTTKRLARATVYGGTMVAMGALAFACSLQTDTATSPTPTNASAAKAVNGQPTYFGAAPTKEAHVAPGGPAPRYPDLLRTKGVAGSVLAQFVVDTSGHVDMGTFRVLKTTDDLFTAAVRATLPNTPFIPAEVNGRKVRQLLQMPFDFSLTKTGERLTAQDTAMTAHGRPSLVRSGVAVPPQRGTDLSKPSDVAGPGIFFEFQVEKAVAPRPGNPAPRYPDALRQANIEGEVLAQFVVDELGHADMATFKTLKATDTAFTSAVVRSLPNMTFSAAEIGGRQVKQLVQMPFQFSLSKR